VGAEVGPPADYATEATLREVATEATLEELRDRLPADPETGLAQETTLEQVRDGLPASPETGLAKEATLAEVRDGLPESPETGLAKETTLQAARDALASLATEATAAEIVAAIAAIPTQRDFHVGTWDYRCGSSGTPDLPDGAKVTSIACVGDTGGGEFTINGGDTIPVEPAQAFRVSLDAEVQDPVIEFAGTKFYFLQFEV
jgi:hypothetical protein